MPSGTQPATHLFHLLLWVIDKTPGLLHQVDLGLKAEFAV